MAIPLSTLRTELVWEGKYDEFGNRREVDAAALAMPLQRIETVDEPRARTEAQGGLFDVHKAHLDDFRNMLVWGDNKLVLASLLKEFRGKVDLIYIDPPFDVGADFTMNVALGDEKTPSSVVNTPGALVVAHPVAAASSSAAAASSFQGFPVMSESLIASRWRRCGANRFSTSPTSRARPVVSR